MDFGKVAGIGLVERVAPEPAGPVEDPALQGSAGQREPHDVLALLHVRGVRSSARVHHDVLTLPVELRVVPPAPQIRALLVVRSGGEPHRLHVAVGQRLQDDEGLLPVRLVVVGPIEGRAPVVHRVEEQVLEHDPAVLADDAPVVADARVGRADRLVLDRRRRRRAARDLAADEEGGHQSGVKHPCEQADAGEPPRCLELGALRPVVEPGELDGVERRLHEAQEPDLARRRVLGARQRLGREPADGNQHAGRGRRGAGQQVARLHVACRGRRQEQLAVGEAQDGLEAPEQCLVRVRRGGRGRRGHGARLSRRGHGCRLGHRGHVAAATSSAVMGSAAPTASRTSRWLR